MGFEEWCRRSRSSGASRRVLAMSFESRPGVMSLATQHRLVVVPASLDPAALNAGAE